MPERRKAAAWAATCLAGVALAFSLSGAGTGIFGLGVFRHVAWTAVPVLLVSGALAFAVRPAPAASTASIEPVPADEP